MKEKVGGTREKVGGTREGRGMREKVGGTREEGRKEEGEEGGERRKEVIGG
jgi:hypothetical protein